MSLPNKIVEFFSEIDRGIFIEVGAADGVQQSNTKLLEQRGWRGLLVEPNKQLYDVCVQRRPNSYVINKALVGKDFKNEKIEFFRHNLPLCSFTTEQHKGPDSTSDSEERKKRDVLNSDFVSVITLDDAIAEADLSDREITFLSIDVESYEFNVLGGLDLTKNRPNYILVETAFPDKILEILDGYVLLWKHGDHDYMFEDERGDK